MASIVYNRAKAGFGDGTLDWDSGSQVYRVMLMGTGYTPNADHDYVSDISANEISSGGYVRKTLSGRTVTLDDTNDRAIFTATNVTWTALTGHTIAYVVVYLQVGGDDSTPSDDILVCCLDPADQVTNGGDITAVWNVTTGLFTLS